MSINPVPSGPTPKTGTRRPEDSATASPARADEKSPRTEGREGAKTDNVELSAAARELQGQVEAGSVPSGELSPERLDEIGKRLASGHYETDAVKADVVKQLAEDIEGDTRS